MPAEIFLENQALGNRYDFQDLPLVGRSYDYSRVAQQGASRKNVTVNLNGFLVGDRHTDIISQYLELVSVLESGYLRLYYHDGNQQVIDRYVYVQSYTEPSDWKEYDGNYTIVCSYPSDNTQESAELGLTASYVTEDGTYQFDPIPAYSKSKASMREDPYDLDYADDLRVADQVTITLTGFVQADNPSALQVKMDALDAAFSKDGTLNYLGWSWPVQRGALQWNSDTPINYATYTINFTYRDTALYKIDVSRTNPRLHPFLKVVDRPYCGTPYSKHFPTYVSGQYVTYSVAVKAIDVATAVSILKDELARIVIAGGIENAGGTQKYDERTNSASVTVTYYYNTPVILNW